MSLLDFTTPEYQATYRPAIDKNMQLVQELNTGSRSQQEIQEYLCKITGHPVDQSVSLKLPFCTDFGSNIHFGKNIIINTGVMFTDLGGIFLEDHVMIGPRASLITVNHLTDPSQRNILDVKPIHLRKNVWIGANATILPGVTIGENSIVAAGAVVNHDVPANQMVAGVPAKIIKTL